MNRLRHVAAIAGLAILASGSPLGHTQSVPETYSRMALGSQPLPDPISVYDN